MPESVFCILIDPDVNEAISLANDRTWTEISSAALNSYRELLHRVPKTSHCKTTLVAKSPHVRILAKVYASVDLYPQYKEAAVTILNLQYDT